MDWIKNDGLDLDAGLKVDDEEEADDGLEVEE